MKHIGLFEGIGGFSLAARWAGWETVAWCEWNEFGQRVLRHHFPEAEGWGDIKTMTYDSINDRLTKRYGTDWRNDDIIVTGGFPCQPYSAAGKRLGKEDDRHLWPEMCRLIREIQPTWVVGENVLGLVNWSNGLVFEEVQADLEVEGYEVQPYVLPAAGVGAPHNRQRVFFVAFNSKSVRNTEVGGICEGAYIKPLGICESNNKRNAADISSFGCDNGSNNREERYIQGNVRASAENQSEWNGRECGIGQAGSTAANTDSARLQTQGTEQSATRTSRSGIQRNAADTDSDGQHGSNSQYEVNASKGGQYAQRDIEQVLTNTERIGRFKKCDDNGFTKKAQQAKCREQQFSRTDSTQGGWRNFPTQSPIRFGDDGLSSRLDGITFPKWRQESIKAAGNAIVPQVAYQIFKSINQYNHAIQP